MIDSHCSLTPGVETEDKPPVFLGGTAHLPRSACSPVSLRSTGGFFMAWDRRESDRKYRENHKEERRAHHIKWDSEHREATHEMRRRYRKKNVIKARAQQYALRHIPLKPICEVCGAKATSRHHPDYSKPAEVMHLCRSCHDIEHAKQRSAKEPRDE